MPWVAPQGHEREGGRGAPGTDHANITHAHHIDCAPFSIHDSVCQVWYVWPDVSDGLFLGVLVSNDLSLV